MRIRVGRTYEAPAGVVADANALLAQLAPRSDALHWLVCYFEPGDWWEPVERLVIAEVVPRAALARNRDAVGVTGESLLDELEGPHPRAHAKYDPTLGRLVYRAGTLRPNITERQWQLFRALDGFAMPRWIVQGDRGGHLRAFDPGQQRLLLDAKLPADPPAPGDLPWATVDRRTIDHLAQLDRFRAFARSWAHRTAADVRAEREAAERHYRDRMTAWLGQQVHQIVSDLPGTLDLSDLPYQPLAEQVDEDAVRAADADPTDDYAVRHARPRGDRVLVAT